MKKAEKVIRIYECFANTLQMLRPVEIYQDGLMGLSESVNLF